MLMYKEIHWSPGHCIHGMSKPSCREPQKCLGGMSSCLYTTWYIPVKHLYFLTHQWECAHSRCRLLLAGLAYQTHSHRWSSCLFPGSPVCYPPLCTPDTCQFSLWPAGGGPWNVQARKSSLNDKKITTIHVQNLVLTIHHCTICTTHIQTSYQ